jgi:large subunit ribosomal protein L6
MKKLEKKHIIKIPHNIEVFYNNEKKIIILKGFSGQKSLKINKLLTISSKKQQIELLNDINIKLSNNRKKKMQQIQKTTVSLIKQLLIETTAIIYQKLNFVGVGYRVFPVENFEKHLFLLRLGYSHPIYFKIPQKTKIVSLKFTKLFLYGFSYHELTSTAANIRLNKTPEPYKGKGILYENEKIVLKEGKKI